MSEMLGPVGQDCICTALVMSCRLMLTYVAPHHMTYIEIGLISCTRQAALARQDLSCACLAHNELIIIVICTLG